MAELNFTYGPMKAAKTAQLLIDAYNFEQREGRRILAIKPSVDDRDGQQITTRAGVEPRTVDFVITPDMNVYERLANLGGPLVSRCFVDEAQFLQPNQVDQLNSVALVLDIPVDTYGLRTDFMTKLFPGSKRLFEVASGLRELTVPCMCEAGGNAIYNVRYVDGKLMIDGDQVAIEKGNVSYECLCPQCYYQAIQSVDRSIRNE
jgi:thymidine kinase